MDIICLYFPRKCIVHWVQGAVVSRRWSLTTSSLDAQHIRKHVSRRIKVAPLNIVAEDKCTHCCFQCRWSLADSSICQLVGCLIVPTTDWPSHSCRITSHGSKLTQSKSELIRDQPRAVTACKARIIHRHVRHRHVHQTKGRTIFLLNSTQLRIDRTRHDDGKA